MTLRRYDDLTMRGRWRSTAAIGSASLRADRRRTFLSIVLDIAVGMAGPSLAIGTGLLVDVVAERRSVLALGIAVATLAAAASVIMALSVLADRVRIRLEENVAHHVELEVMGMVTGLTGISHHENPAHLHRVDRLLEESWLVAMAVPALVLLIEAFVRFGVTMALLGSIDGRLLLLPLAVVPSLWAGVVAERIRLRALDVRAPIGRRADDIFRLVADRSYAGELRTMGSAGHLVQRYDESMRVVARDERDHRLRGGWLLAFGRAVFAAAFGFGLVLVAGRAAAGDLSPGGLVMAIGLAGQVIGQATSVSGRLNWINWALTGVRHYVWLVEYDRSHRADGREIGAVPDALVDGIRFENVSFTYPGTSRPVLDGVDLALSPGSVVAVVGDNGAGKTTLVKLLLRFYEPTSGRITVDGLPLDSLPADEWRRRTTAALQDHTRPELLLREAVAIGELSRLDDASVLERALVRSGADAVVADVPRGLDAQLGVEWPGGTDLSGGQWQRVAVGRSAMRDAPLLLVLDEPTAALDPVAEHALFDHYTGALAGARASRGSVTLVISHRLSTVRAADRIVVLADGRIVEDGTHDELVEAGGAYAELFRMQAAAYGSY